MNIIENTGKKLKIDLDPSSVEEADLPIVHVAPAHGVAYDITGQGIADESGMRNAIYLAIDIFRNRIWEEEIHSNPLRKQYFDKRDDSYKLKLDAPEEETL